MVEVMKIMVTSFKRSHAGIATLSAPSPAAGHHPPHLCWPGHTRASLGQSLGGFWYTQGSVCALQESVSPVLCKFWWLYGELMVTSSKRAYAIPRFIALRAPALAAVHC